MVEADLRSPLGDFPRSPFTDDIARLRRIPGTRRSMQSARLVGWVLGPALNPELGGTTPTCSAAGPERRLARQRSWSLPMQLTRSGALSGRVARAAIASHASLVLRPRRASRLETLDTSPGGAAPAHAGDRFGRRAVYARVARARRSLPIVRTVPRVPPSVRIVHVIWKFD